MDGVVLFNNRAGTAARLGEDAQAVRRRFAQAGLDVVVEDGGDEDLAARSRDASRAGARVVIAAGGDGTISTVAGALVGTSSSLGVLPAGTRNHFARDLGIPLDMDEAIHAILHGRTRTVDVGEVNGRIFINNASIGLYPDMVGERELHQRRGVPKGLAMFWSSLLALRRFRLLRVRLATEVDWRQPTTPFVFVGNNEYSMDLFALGQRQCLDQGTLSIYTANVHRRFALLRLMSMALLGRLEQSRDFEQLCVPEAWLDSHFWRRLRVALDGELISLSPPLHFQARPAALRVRVPSAS